VLTAYWGIGIEGEMGVWLHCFSAKQQLVWISVGSIGAPFVRVPLVNGLAAMLS
jgi:hypothetical protein